VGRTRSSQRGNQIVALPATAINAGTKRHTTIASIATAARLDAFERLPRPSRRRAQDERRRDPLVAEVLRHPLRRLATARSKRAIVVREVLVVPARLRVA
jgi:hypothetical protein